MGYVIVKDPADAKSVTGAFLTDADKTKREAFAVGTDEQLQELSSSDIEKVFNDTHIFSSSGGAITVATNPDFNGTNDAEMYNSKLDQSISNIKSLNSSHVEYAELQEYLEFLNTIDISSLTIDPNTSFRQYVMSVNSDKYWDPMFEI